MPIVKPGRNDPCSCGSGKKYKKCCAGEVAGEAAQKTPAPDALPAAQLESLYALHNAGKFAELAERATALLQSHAETGILWKFLGSAQQQLSLNAVAALEQASRLLPQDAEAWNMLGIALRDAGDAGKAEQAYRQALQLKTGFAEAHANLGLTLCDLGRPGEGEASCRRALELKPDFVVALNNLGLALREQGKLDDALVSYQKALQLQPGVAELHHNIGNVFEEQNRFEDAASCYRRATELNPAYLGAYINLARMMRHMGNDLLAAQLCAKVLEVNPAFGPAHILDYQLHNDAGRFDAAEAALRRIDPANSSYPAAWSGIPLLRRMGPEDSTWLERASELVSRQLLAREESLLRFAMGKYFDDIGTPDEAFQNYRQAHDLMKKFASPYNRQAQQPAIDALVRAFGSEWIARRRGAGNSSAKPVLVIGMPRSGTSLVEQILASHPDVFGAGELDFWHNEWQSLLSSGTEVDDLALARIAQRYLGQLDQFAPAAARVVDKMPGNFMYLGLVHAAFPHARIIHVQRDPIDTCLSIYFQRLGNGHPYANDLDDLAYAYRMYRYAMAQWQTILPENTFLHLPYEALVSDQETWSRRLIEFVGLPWDARCLDFHLQQRKVGTASNWQVRQKMNQGSVERWRLYERHLGPLLALREDAPPA